MSKTVLITGGSRGIGAAAARLFAKNGFTTIINYRASREAAEALSREIGATAMQADISDSEAVARMFSEIGERFGGVDILVNNAGVAEQALFTDITEQMWDRMFNINVKGAFLCTKAALPYMIHEKRGRIINISSMWGSVGASCEVHYSAAKAALTGMTRALAKELGPSGITVNAVAPGVISTDMNSALSADTLAALADETPLCRIGRAEEVAEAIFFLASDRADFITGQVIGVNGGFVI